ncbi:MAG: NAD/NADP octopine/nopaline dehydrogenase family protein [Muribaculaceae bacterium]|nr:NAD/NADP octopine/nopaline dehydrogenase family protein [Muribaculaceae bacterium]
MDIVNVVIAGGGSLGHVIAGWLSTRGYDVSILTRRPLEWSRNLTVKTPDGIIHASIRNISDNPAEVIPEADLILLTVPGYANASVLSTIKPYLKVGCFLGAVFCSSGFFFEAFKIIPDNIILWGFQRVPFIARIVNYGKEADIRSFKSELQIAVERADEKEKEKFRRWIEMSFNTPVTLRSNYLEVSITNSNPILHTARLYSMFHDWCEDVRYDHNILFYEEWTEEAADLLIRMDTELFELLKHLPVDVNYLVPLLEYYESTDAVSLAAKLASIKGFKGIRSPMKKDNRGWYPDFSDRYFTEDFGYSLRFIYELTVKYHVDAPYIDKIYQWGKGVIDRYGRFSRLDEPRS